VTVSRPCATSVREVGEEAGTGSWASRSAMSDDLCVVLWQLEDLLDFSAILMKRLGC
jgi:hypothetical protein